MTTRWSFLFVVYLCAVIPYVPYASSACVLTAKDFPVESFGAIPNDSKEDTKAIQDTFEAACTYSQQQLNLQNGDISGCTMSPGSPSNKDLYVRYNSNDIFDVNNVPIAHFFPSELLLARIVFSHNGVYLWKGPISFPSCYYVRVEGNQSTWLQTDRGKNGNFISWNNHKHIVIGDLTIDWDDSAPTFVGGVITTMTSQYMDITVSPPHKCTINMTARVIYPMDLVTDPENAFPSAAYGGFYWVYPEPTSPELYYNGLWPYSLKQVSSDSGYGGDGGSGGAGGYGGGSGGGSGGCVLRLQHPDGHDFSKLPQLKVGTNLSVSSWQVAALTGSTADPILYHSIKLMGGPGNAILGRDQSTLLINIWMGRKPGFWAGIGSANGLGLQRRALILIDNVFDSAEDDWVNQACSYQALGKIYDATHIQLVGRHMTEGVEGFYKPFDYIALSHSDDGEGFLPYVKVQLMKVTYDSHWNTADFVLMSHTPLPSEAVVGDTIWNANFSVNLLSKGCTYKNSRGNGLLAKGANMLIEDNTFLNLAFCGVSTITDQTYWFEATPSNNITIRNNRFQRTSLWDSNTHAIGVNALTYNKAVHVMDGTFPPPGATVINPPKATSNVTIENNIFDCASGSISQPSKMEGGMIYMGSAESVTITGNTFRVHSALANNLALIDLCNVQDGRVHDNNIGVDQGWHLVWNSTQKVVDFAAQVWVETITQPHGYEVELFNVDAYSGCNLGITSKSLDNSNAFQK